MNDMSPFLTKTPSLIPESAPFSEEQRAWLNGFFSGFVALEKAAAEGVAGIPSLAPDDAVAGLISEADDAPWHDQTLPIVERMTLAEGRPLRRRIMAAMAQQDCGQCGYNCNDYADAIADKKEARLNLCVPGGKETARALKALYGEIDAAPAPALSFQVTDQPSVSVANMQTGTSRDHPAEVIFLERKKLNKAGSEKDTWHVDFDLQDTGIEYAAGDSFGVFPQNHPALVRDILTTLWIDPQKRLNGRTLQDIFEKDFALGAAPDTLFQLISYLADGDKRKRAKALAAGEDPDGDAAILDVLAALRKFPGVRPGVEAFMEALEPMQPRLYSISSSPKAKAGRVSLTVDCVRYAVNRRERLGCASTFLADRIAPGTALKAYVQKAHNFALPDNPAIPIIMVGPGTGIAPFRAFLQERNAVGAPGKNWLFFGHQRSACDFFYKDELTVLKAKGVLTRLSLAWSRDNEQKFYVQDRMRETGRELWTWLQEGAHFYICGDAKRMAKDVERALIEIAATHGGLSPDASIGWVADLKKAKRYQADVY